jgi:Uma2 family endonuclease
MSVDASLKPLAVAADLLAIPEHERFHEIIDGDLVRKAAPSARHGFAQGVVAGRVGETYNRRPGGRRPGGWWIVTEVEIQLDVHEVYRPDVSGWRRERLPELPVEWPMLLRPDWVCEVLSQTTARNDLVKKMRVYHRCGVPHYWIVDPDQETLTVYRWTAEGYLVALTAERQDRVRAEPFGDIELSVGTLFGDDSDDE